MNFHTDEWADHSRDQEFMAEFQANIDVYERTGMTRDAYLRTRRIDEGLQKLQVPNTFPPQPASAPQGQ